MEEDRLRTRVIRTQRGEAWVVPRAVLRTLGGPGAPASVEMGAHALRIGTDPGCEVRLDDPAVSALHAEVAPTPLGHRLRDLGSTNGTWLDGRRVGEIHLGARARFVVGETTLELELQDASDEVALSRATSFGGLLGHSPPMRAVIAVLEQAARSDATVLVLGESGTGKELAARALHDKSARHAGPFVVFDCGAASASLLEAHLFGHARGAFTGAAEAREGVFEAADGGTLVLDEIGELPLELQPKLLRALEARTVTRIGESKPRAFDVRFVASTHRNLLGEARAGRFREDLYYRLGVITVVMPALRERKEEIGRLLRHFVQKLGKDRPVEVPEHVVAMLAGHAWPGNVRELRNFAERYLALPGASPQSLLSESVGAAGRVQSASPAAFDPLAAPFHDAKRDAIEAFERTYFAALLARHRENLSEAARVSGLSRQTCYRLMHKHGLGDG